MNPYWLSIIALGVLLVFGLFFAVVNVIGVEGGKDGQS